MRSRFSFLLAGTLAFAGSVYPGEKPTPCSLISRPEIEAVQGEEVVDTKASRPERRDFDVGQCFYTLTTFAKSISLEVTRRDADDPASKEPKDLWMSLFHGGSKESGPEGAADKESGRPQPVAGVGDEAFWISDGVVGALYVFKGGAFLRISIGGPDEQPVKIHKSKSLAKKALKRL